MDKLIKNPTQKNNCYNEKWPSLQKRTQYITSSIAGMPQLSQRKTKQGLVCLISGSSEKTTLQWLHEGYHPFHISRSPFCCFPMYPFIWMSPFLFFSFFFFFTLYRNSSPLSPCKYQFSLIPASLTVPLLFEGSVPIKSIKFLSRPRTILTQFSFFFIKIYTTLPNHREAPTIWILAIRSLILLSIIYS